MLTSGGELLGRAVTGADGRATLALARAITAHDQPVLTVTAPNCAPYRVTVPVQGAAAPVDDQTPATSRLVGNYPNPCNPHTTVVFALARAAHVSLRIYDLHGRLVQDLVRADLAAGDHEVAWNGIDSGGRLVASGTYVASLVADGVTSTRTLVLVR